MKGQTSMEYVILVGAILVLVIPIFYYVTFQSSQTIKTSEADDAVKSIARTADTVYALGPGAKNYVWITIPSGVTNTNVTSKSITVSLFLYGDESDITAFTKANVTGNVPAEKGTYRISVEVLDSGVVQIG